MSFADFASVWEKTFFLEENTVTAIPRKVKYIVGHHQYLSVTFGSFNNFSITTSLPLSALSGCF